MEEIINSIMHNPENTNPNVLRDQLRGISSGAGAGVVIVDEETVHGVERLNIKAGELYNLAKNNIIFCKQIISTPEGSGELYTILQDYFCVEDSTVSVYYFKFYNLNHKIITFIGRVDNYPSTFDVK